MDALQLALVVDASFRGFQHDRVSKLASCRERGVLGLDDAACVGRQARLLDQRKCLVLVEAPPVFKPLAESREHGLGNG